MQIGIDSFAAAHDDTSRALSATQRLRNLIEEIEYADQVGLDICLHVAEVLKGWINQPVR